MVMAGSSIVSCLRTFVFFRLMASPKSLQAWEIRSISVCSSCWVWLVTAASSANSMSLMRASRTFVLALRQPRLKSLPTDLIRRPIPSDAVPKACLKKGAKKIWRFQRVGARTHPSLTPLRMSRGLEELPLNCTVPFMFVWKDSMMLCDFGGQSIFGKIWKRPSLLTRSNAFVGSMKAIYRGICCFLHFSCSWRRQKTMSIVDLPPPARMPHCDSG